MNTREIKKNIRRRIKKNGVGNIFKFYIKIDIKMLIRYNKYIDKKGEKINGLISRI